MTTSGFFLAGVGLAFAVLCIAAAIAYVHGGMRQ